MITKRYLREGKKHTILNDGRQFWPKRQWIRQHSANRLRFLEKPSVSSTSRFQATVPPGVQKKKLPQKRVVRRKSEFLYRFKGCFDAEECIWENLQTFQQVHGCPFACGRALCRSFTCTSNEMSPSHHKREKNNKRRREQRSCEADYSSVPPPPSTAHPAWSHPRHWQWCQSF